MATTSPSFQELSGRGELHTSGWPSIGVLYFIPFLAPLAPPSSQPLDAVGTKSVATGHMTQVHLLARTLDLTAAYTLALADGRQIAVNLVASSMEQFSLYTFECAAHDLV